MRPPATAEESSDSAPGPQTTCRVEEGVGWDGTGGAGRSRTGRDGTRVEGREGWGEMEHPDFGAMRMEGVRGGSQEGWEALEGWGLVGAGPSWSDLTNDYIQGTFLRGFKATSSWSFT